MQINLLHLEEVAQHPLRTFCERGLRDFGPHTMKLQTEVQAALWTPEVYTQHGNRCDHYCGGRWQWSTTTVIVISAKGTWKCSPFQDALDKFVNVQILHDSIVVVGETNDLNQETRYLTH